MWGALDIRSTLPIRGAADPPPLAELGAPHAPTERPGRSTDTVPLFFGQTAPGPEVLGEPQGVLAATSPDRAPLTHRLGIELPRPPASAALTVGVEEQRVLTGAGGVALPSPGIGRVRRVRVHSISSTCASSRISRSPPILLAESSSAGP